MADLCASKIMFGVLRISGPVEGAQEILEELRRAPGVEGLRF